MTEHAMRQARLDLYAPAPAELPTIRTCRACGFLRYAALDCYGCESADKPTLPRAPLPPVVAPEPHRDPPAALPERRPPGREICDPLPLRRQAWKARA
jgi:hypothetical protein